MRVVAAVTLLGALTVNSLAEDGTTDFARPYTGPSKSEADSSTLTGKVMCGYQGWFNCEGDGAGLGWVHWARDWRKPFAPGNVTVDLWPDLSEFEPDERFTTGFRRADGSPAEVFSSFKRRTVVRHFEWMRQYGIDGAFVQRFAVNLGNQAVRNHRDAVLAHAREGANRAGRAYAVMYDLSGLKAGETVKVQEDWRRLRREMQITKDPAYLQHEGQPVVSVWGIGFSDNRPYTLRECRKLIVFLKRDGCAVMIGVPTWWREGKRDAVSDLALRAIIESADIVSPWTVGRYRTPLEAARHGKNVWRPDLAWCSGRDIDFLPVVFPGFSWHNLNGDKLDAIPRRKGEFLWSQFAAARRAGCKMVYVAMFDEVDEGTAIFKCVNDPPRGKRATFLDYEGLPSDFYLGLVGEGARLLRDEIPLTDALPVFRSDSKR